MSRGLASIWRRARFRFARSKRRARSWRRGSSRAVGSSAIFSERPRSLAATEACPSVHVRARLAPRAEDWRWSSVRGRLAGRDDELVSVAPLLERFGGRFVEAIKTAPSAEALSAPRAAKTIGRPLGSAAFLDGLAALTGRDPRPTKCGPKAGKRGLSKVST